LKVPLIPSPRFSSASQILLLGLCLSLHSIPQAQADVENPSTSPYLQELIHRATQLGLADQRYWHLLLHYRPNVIEGFTSQADDPDFFLAPSGKTDPQAELEATLRAFFSSEEFGETPQHAQCAFVARYHWLSTQLAFDEHRLPRQSCQHFQLWLQELNPAGVSLIFPSAFLNNPPSMFAHTLLRIDQAEQTEETKLLAYTINFAARPTTDFVLAYAYMGLTGGFKGYFSIKPYYLMVKEYGDIQNRDIWEYQLAFTQEEIHRMLMHEWELQGIHFDYFFFKENCAYQIVSLLEIAKPELHLTDQFYLWTIPGETVRLISQEPGLVKQVTFITSRTTSIRRKVDALQSNETQILSLLIHDPTGFQDSRFQSLSPERQVFLLDLAIDYLQDHFNGREKEAVEEQAQLHRLLTARSELNVLPPPLFINPFTSRPELGHKPARVGIGVGWRQDEFFEEVTLRAAYHDLLDPDPGYVPNSQIELLSFSLRHYNTRDQTRLEKLTFANIISLTPIDTLIKAPSWKVSAELDTVSVNGCRYCRNFRFNGGVGLTGETHLIGSEVFFALPELEVDYSQAYDKNYRAGGGITGGFLTSLTPRWKILATGSYLRFPLGESSEAFRAFFGQRYTLQQNLALRFDFKHRKKDNEAVFQIQAYF
jgi:hypothetical protein